MCLLSKNANEKNEREKKLLFKNLLSSQKSIYKTFLLSIQCQVMPSDAKWDHWVKEANGHVVIDC